MSLFKYMPACRLYPIEEGTIRFTQLGRLNDLEEGVTDFSEIDSAPIDVTNIEIAVVRSSLPASTRDRLSLDEFSRRYRESLEEIARRAKELEPKVAAEISAALHSRLDDEGKLVELGAFDRNFGILCLAPDGDDVRMWSEHANNEGFAVEIDECDPFWSQHSFGAAWIGRFKQVSYVAVRSFQSMADTSFEEIVFTKHEKWSNQREWRLVLPLDPRILRCQGKDPRKYDIWVADLPPRVIKSVIAGPHIASNRLTEIRERLRGGTYGHVSLKRADLDPHGTGGRFKITPVT